MRTTEAANYRLRHDPLGPIALADALTKDLTLNSQAADVSQMRASQLAFGLVEISLTLAHVCRRIHADRNPGDHDVRPLYREVMEVLLGRANGPDNSERGVGSLGDYIDAVRIKCAELVRAGD